MSIYYIVIDSFNESGDPVKSHTVELFKNEEEMVRWFAYDYDNEYGRYHRMLNSQRCCKGDIFVSEYRYFPESDLSIPRKYAYRNHMLYDAKTCRILDIRNYETEIVKSATIGIYNTEYVLSYRKRDFAVWKHNHGHKHGKTHQKSGHFKKIALGKNNVKQSDEKFGRYEQEDMSENLSISKLSCSFPVQIRGKTRMKKLGWWDDYYASTENNWKEKKIRHQWQYHQKDDYTVKPNVLRKKYKLSEMFSNPEEDEESLIA